MNEELIDYCIGKLTELQIQTHCEDRKRGKVRYIQKEQAIRDLIKLLRDIKREVL